MSFLKYIFSISEEDRWHKTINIFGIKINILKHEYAKKKKENQYYYYKKNNIDITTLPPATGQLRDLQLANLALLKEFDYVCKTNNLNYWLSFGSLLGAIRHKGFIPWDDDIDVGMMREDYNKIIDAFAKSSRNPDIFAVFVHNNEHQYHIKIKHKKCPYLFLDVFPNDFYVKELSLEEELKTTKTIKQYRKNIADESGFDPATEELLPVINKYKKELLKDNLSDKKEIVWGLEFNHLWKNWFNKYDEIFPLQEVEFENFKFTTVNKPHEVLNKIYGNYMSYPKKLGSGHNMMTSLTKEEREVINNIIKDIR